MVERQEAGEASWVRSAELIIQDVFEVRVLQSFSGADSFIRVVLEHFIEQVHGLGVGQVAVLGVDEAGPGALGVLGEDVLVSGDYVELLEEGELVLVHEGDELVGAEHRGDLVDLVDDGLAVEERRLLEDLLRGDYDRREDAAGCPDVDGEVVVAQLEDDLWRLEVLRADLERQRVVRQVELGESGQWLLPEVDNLQGPGLGVVGEVVWLDVAVDEALGVHLVERLGQRRAP